jgi:hypothetical protein
MSNGDDASLNPQPIPPGRLAFYEALSALAMSAFLDDDSISGGVNPKGPGGPVMRDITAAVAISQIASVLTDRKFSKQIQGIAARIATEAGKKLG